MDTGKVKTWLEDRGFGFITGDDGRDIFVHARQLPRGVRVLRAGDRVQYDKQRTERGIQAYNISMLDGDDEYADVITVAEYRRELIREVPASQPYCEVLVKIAMDHGWVTGLCPGGGLS